MRLTAHSLLSPELITMGPIAHTRGLSIFYCEVHKSPTVASQFTYSVVCISPLWSSHVTIVSPRAPEYLLTRYETPILLLWHPQHTPVRPAAHHCGVCSSHCEAGPENTIGWYIIMGPTDDPLCGSEFFSVMPAADSLEMPSLPTVRFTVYSQWVSLVIYFEAHGSLPVTSSV